MKKHSIPHIDEITALYQSALLEKSPTHKDFDILFFSDLHSGTKKMFPPHRRNFCTIIFFEDQKGGKVSINANQHQGLTNAILFQGPEHIFSFLRDEKVEGSILLFKPSFLLPFVNELEFRYPFFNITNQNLFHLSSKEKEAFGLLLRVIHTERRNSEMVKHLLLALLEKCLLLYQTYAKEEQYIAKKDLLVRRFKQLINNCFITHKQVDFYAKNLNISPNHLNEIVKSQTGKTAKRHILDRLLLEAKNMLRYTDMDVSEIAFSLNYSETTHFNRFFKKETQLTPRAFRKQDH